MKFTNSIVTLTLCIICLFLTGCSDDDDDVPVEEKIPSVEPIVAAMKTMTPLGYAASMFMARINETDPANTECAASLCVTTLEIPFDQPTRESFPVELQAEGTAKLYVAGAWTPAGAGGPIEAAVISLLFIDMRGGSFGFPAYEITTIPITKTELGISTVYSGSDIGVDKDKFIDAINAKNAIKAEIDDLSIDALNSAFDELADRLQDILNNESIIDSLQLNLFKDYWLVNVEDVNNTPNDFSDDAYGLSGGRVYAGLGLSSGSVYKLGLANVIMGNHCKTNPSNGKAVISELQADAGNNIADGLQLGYVTLQFDSMCDGNAYVLSGWGSYGAIEGQRVPLNFNE